MTSIGGKAVGDQYLPSYLSISSWYSPSRCHIQIQSPSTLLKASISYSRSSNLKFVSSVAMSTLSGVFVFFLQVGQKAEVALKSTCPCNFTLHYEVTSRGNIVLSGQQLSNTTASQRGKRATVTFDMNVPPTHPPPFSSGKHVFISCLRYCQYSLLIHFRVALNISFALEFSLPPVALFGPKVM